MATIQINALEVAATPFQAPFSEIFHLKQGVTDKQCKLSDILYPHTSITTGNPHNVTKTDVKLGNVDDLQQFAVSRLFSEISTDNAKKATARQNLDIISKAEVTTQIDAHANRKDNPHGVTKVQVQLGNVPNWTTTNSYIDNLDAFASSHALNALYKAIQAQYPVGSVHLSYSNRNPGTYLLCGGTWVLASQGRAIVGATATTDQSGRQFGARTVRLVVANLPPHNHTVTLTGGNHTHGATFHGTPVANHTHGVSGSTAAFDPPPVTTSAFDYGTKTTSSYTHAHSFRDWYYPEHIDAFHKFNNATVNSHIEPNTNPWVGSGDTDGDDNYVMFKDKTTGNNTHNHTVGIGAHTHSVNLPAHSHSFSVTSAAAGGFTPAGSITVANNTTHTHSGSTDNTGAGTEFSVEQPSEVLFVWKRTA